MNLKSFIRPGQSQADPRDTIAATLLELVPKNVRIIITKESTAELIVMMTFLRKKAGGSANGSRDLNYHVTTQRVSMNVAKRVGVSIANQNVR
jgi:hypothetical protein